uniref:Ovule protein n=1 Tax=Schistosoma curassoni TaxID=6186 RepID=A0A183K6B5_9TREM
LTYENIANGPWIAPAIGSSILYFNLFKSSKILFCLLGKHPFFEYLVIWILLTNLSKMEDKIHYNKVSVLKILHFR